MSRLVTVDCLGPRVTAALFCGEPWGGMGWEGGVLAGVVRSGRLFACSRLKADRLLCTDRERRHKVVSLYKRNPACSVERSPLRGWGDKGNVVTIFPRRLQWSWWWVMKIRDRGTIGALEELGAPWGRWAITCSDRVMTESPGSYHS